MVALWFKLTIVLDAFTTTTNKTIIHIKSDVGLK